MHSQTCIAVATHLLQPHQGPFTFSTCVLIRPGEQLNHYHNRAIVIICGADPFVHVFDCIAVQSSSIVSGRLPETQPGSGAG